MQALAPNPPPDTNLPSYPHKRPNIKRRNQLQTNTITEPSGIDAVVPKPLSASANVLVMTYCPGVKVTDPKGRSEYMCR